MGNQPNYLSSSYTNYVARGNTIWGIFWYVPWVSLWLWCLTQCLVDQKENYPVFVDWTEWFSMKDTGQLVKQNILKNSVMADKVMGYKISKKNSAENHQDKGLSK